MRNAGKGGAGLPGQIELNALSTAVKFPPQREIIGILTAKVPHLRPGLTLQKLTSFTNETPATPSNGRYIINKRGDEDLNWRSSTLIIVLITAAP